MQQNCAAYQIALKEEMTSTTLTLSDCMLILLIWEILPEENIGVAIILPMSLSLYETFRILSGQFW